MRLQYDELVYSGVIRSSVMSLANKVPYAGEWQSLVAENFATTADVYRILNLLNEEDDLMETADGEDKNRTASIKRLARMFGGDAQLTEEDQWQQAAEYLAEMQLQRITNAVLRVLSHRPLQDIKIVGAGAGRFLVEKIAQRLDTPYIDFSQLIQTEDALTHISNVCAPAVALAQLNRLYHIA